MKYRSPTLPVKSLRGEGPLAQSDARSRALLVREWMVFRMDKGRRLPGSGKRWKKMEIFRNMLKTRVLHDRIGLDQLTSRLVLVPECVRKSLIINGLLGILLAGARFR